MESGTDSDGSGEDLTSYLLSVQQDSPDQLDDGSVKEIILDLPEDEDPGHSAGGDFEDKSLYFGELYNVDQPFNSDDLPIGERVKYGMRRRAADRPVAYDCQVDRSLSDVEPCHVRVLTDWDCAYAKIESIIEHRSALTQVLPLAEIISLSLYGIKEFSREVVDSSDTMPGLSWSQSDIPEGKVICIGPVVKYLGFVEGLHGFEVCVNPEYRSDALSKHLLYSVRQAINSGITTYRSKVHIRETREATESQAGNDLLMAMDGVQIAMLADRKKWEKANSGQGGGKQCIVNKSHTMKLLQLSKTDKSLVKSRKVELVPAPSTEDCWSDDNPLPAPALSVLTLSKTIETKYCPCDDTARKPPDKRSTLSEPISSDGPDGKSAEIISSENCESRPSTSIDFRPPLPVSVNPHVLVIQPDEKWLSQDAPASTLSVSHPVKTESPNGCGTPGDFPGNEKETGSEGVEGATFCADDETFSSGINSRGQDCYIAPSSGGKQYFPGYIPGRNNRKEPFETTTKNWYASEYCDELVPESNQTGLGGDCHHDHFDSYQGNCYQNHEIPTVIKTEPVDPDLVAQEVFCNGNTLSFKSLQNGNQGTRRRKRMVIKRVTDERLKTVVQAEKLRNRSFLRGRGKSPASFPGYISKMSGIDFS